MGAETLASFSCCRRQSLDGLPLRFAPKPPRAASFAGALLPLPGVALDFCRARRSDLDALLQWGSRQDEQRPASLLAASANVSFFLCFFVAPIAPSPWDGDGRRRRLDSSLTFSLSPSFTKQHPQNQPRRTCPSLRTSTTVSGMMGIWLERGSLKARAKGAMIFLLALFPIDGPRRRENDGGWPRQRGSGPLPGFLLARRSAPSPVSRLQSEGTSPPWTAGLDSEEKKADEKAASCMLVFFATSLSLPLSSLSLGLLSRPLPLSLSRPLLLLLLPLSSLQKQENPPSPTRSSPPRASSPWRPPATSA